MYTQCPQCKTIYEIDEDALQASLGIVRCGECSERFDALRTLSDALPASADAALPEHDPESVTPTLTEAVSADAINAAAKRRRKRAPKPAAPAKVEPPSAPSPGNRAPEHDWLTPQSGARTQALIADAAGIPPEAIQGDDPAWLVIDLPIQTSFNELDIIPMAPLEEDAVPVTKSVAASTQASAASEPLGDARTVDVLAIDAPTEAAPESPRPELAGEVDSSGSGAAVPAIDAAPADASEPGVTETESSTEPIYLPPRPRRIRRSDWLWALGCLLLALALAAQLAWAKRAALVLNPATQAWTLRACANLDCQLPPIRDIAKLELLSRDIRPDPDRAGALMITATLRNDAPFRQPWPVVVVELSNLDNTPVAMRRFRPVEYMPNPARRAAGITSGTTAAVAFEVADPGKQAVNFHFSFE
ncbi:MAG TPA: DUF3426 domain-containing protein [Rhodanobacteraceae bacterium]